MYDAAARLYSHGEQTVQSCASMVKIASEHTPTPNATTLDLPGVKVEFQSSDPWIKDFIVDLAYLCFFDLIYGGIQDRDWTERLICEYRSLVIRILSDQKVIVVQTQKFCLIGLASAFVRRKVLA